ncbi:MAG TPA: insulinase family protein [Ferruginibacter sp.]|nr:insulinase family protein [Ferruginibacter sp.]
MKTSLLGILCYLLFSIHTTAQPLADQIQLDQQVKMGKLPNGLTYYIRKNSKPENRAELRLVVNAGSVLERDDQQGIAHFLEHMAFNGTKNFPKNELLSYLQKAGVRFGADLNATTNFDYTLYMLPIPSNDETVLTNGYQVLRDWAGNLLLETEEIDKERGIILEEKRMRQNAGQRVFAQYLPTMTNNSKYGQRIPIGKEDIIKTAPRKAFTDFYSDWYRPDNMAIIVVGDIDLTKTEAQIKKLFSDLVNPVNAPARPTITPIQWHQTNTAKLVSDAENTNNFLSIYMGLEQSKEQSNWQSYGKNLLYEMISNLFDGRLRENFVNPSSPITYGNINLKASFLRGYETSSITALVKDNPAAAISMLIAEILKAQQFGFTQAELDRVKKNTLKQYEEMLLEKDKTESAGFVNEYVEHFLNKEPSPGIEAEQKFVARFINEINLDKINGQVKSFDLSKPAFIVFNATEAMKNSITETGILNALEKAKLQKTEAYAENKISMQLMDEIPKPGKIINSTFNKDLDAHTLALSNGITVIYKKTNFKNDEIVFRGSQWGGMTSLLPGEIKQVKYMPLTGSLGLGKHKAIDLPKILSGVEANLFISPGVNQLLINGNTNVADMEKFMQILNLKLTQVNFDATEFEGIKNNYASQVGGLLKNPSYKFSDTLNAFKYNYSNRLPGFPSATEVKALQLNDLKNVYKKMTGNLQGAVFVFSGNIDEKTFHGLVSTYIASIPTNQQPRVLVMENMLKPITGKNSFTFKAGKEKKSEINYGYYGKVAETDHKEVQTFILMGEILQMKANQKLREEMGSTYAPSVSNSIIRQPVGEFNIGLTVSSLPENTDKIIQAFDELVQQIINGEMNEDDLQKAKAQRLKVVENFFKNNNYWCSLLEQQFSYDFKALNWAEYNNTVQDIFKEDIIQVAKKYLTKANTLKAVMNPE